MKEKILIIPRNDGMAVSAGGKVYIVEMTAEQMLDMALRCQQAGLEMMRVEKNDDSDKG
jgi:hypothetical protein|tara:strand:- start:59 stop:235 length:177 start_codon:yes stop_codon:yes gene_type:complete